MPAHAPRTPSTLLPYQAWLRYWGNLVWTARKQQKLTQEAVVVRANACIVSQRTVSRTALDDLEKGCPKGTNLTMDKFLGICAALDLDVSLLTLPPTAPLGALVQVVAAEPPEKAALLLEIVRLLAPKSVDALEVVLDFYAHPPRLRDRSQPPPAPLAHESASTT